MKKVISINRTVTDKDNPNTEDTKKGDTTMNNTTIFNFKENWDRVEPYLSDLKILELLDKGMSKYIDKSSKGDMPSWDRRNGIGPWEYSYSVQFEHEKAVDLMNGSPEWERWNERYRFLSDFNSCDIAAAAQDPDNPKMKELYESFVEEQQALLATFLPEAGTYRWFRCLGADRELAPWQKALAEKVFPEYKWEILEIRSQSCPDIREDTVIGTRPNGSRMIFDLLKFEYYTAEEILKSAMGTDCNCAV